MQKMSSEAAAAEGATLKQAQIEQLRVDAVIALGVALERGSKDEPLEVVKEPLSAFLQELRASTVAGEETVVALGNTIEKEALLGCDSTNFKRWGNHYFRTLACMLKAERRSNFRDECMQHFGKDKRKRDALFEEQSNAAEMRFATLKPPEPSLLRPPPPPAAASLGSAPGTMPAMAAPPPRPMALPDEFMRGGGCFGPNATVRLISAGGQARTVLVSQVRAGDSLLGEGGRIAHVRCVVLTECAGGRVMLSRLPSGLELTEWHPVRCRRALDPQTSGDWPGPGLAWPCCPGPGLSLLAGLALLSWPWPVLALLSWPCCPGPGLSLPCAPRHFKACRGPRPAPFRCGTRADAGASR